MCVGVNCAKEDFQLEVEILGLECLPCRKQSHLKIVSGDALRKGKLLIGKIS